MSGFGGVALVKEMDVSCGKSNFCMIFLSYLITSQGCIPSLQKNVTKKQFFSQMCLKPTSMSNVIIYSLHLPPTAATDRSTSLHMGKLSFGFLTFFVTPLVLYTIT
jgi:hypothetical protein